MSRDLPGVLDGSAYAALAQLHRPSNPEQLAAEIRRLRGSGLSPRDIATALRLSLDEVVNILADAAPEIAP
jgi:DNA-directed RNA polymerase specialized sigma24 family protein